MFIYFINSFVFFLSMPVTSLVLYLRGSLHAIYAFLFAAGPKMFSSGIVDYGYVQFSNYGILLWYNARNTGILWDFITICNMRIPVFWIFLSCGCGILVQL